MPAILKVKIIQAQNLPIMDRASELTDAFVEIKFNNTILKTDVCKKTLNPLWNSDWFKFEVDDEELQDEPLQIRVLDHDTYTSHDAIGKIYIDLNPLLNSNKSSSINGWFPIFDTIHGIQGQLLIAIKLDHFQDSNKFRKSSCGVKIFCSPGVPDGYTIVKVHGFVEDLMVHDDPEYQWIDKIRSMRASNEARQIKFTRLSGQLQRKIGLKVQDMGGNAILGFRQCFDLEGESGVVIRAIGTSVTLNKSRTRFGSSPFTSINNTELIEEENPLDSSFTHTLSFSATSPHRPFSSIFRRLSESDADPPSKTLTSGQVFTNSKSPFFQPHLFQDNITMIEYPFLTLKVFPPGFLMQLGGVVSSSSVKLLDQDEARTQNEWWNEIRSEIRCHMRAVGCQVVVGYRERTCIRGDLIVLSAIGTAAIVDPDFRDEANKDYSPCSIYHAVNSDKIIASSLLKKCNICKTHKVPDILFSTTEPPSDFPIQGRGSLIQARICHAKKDSKAETNAKDVSDSLPFVEYELHKQLVNKLKSMGMNSLFCLTMQLVVGDSRLIAIATATAAYCEALPTPSIPIIINKIDVKYTDEDIQTIEKNLRDAIQHNKILFGLEDCMQSKLSLVNEYCEDFGDYLIKNDSFTFELDDMEKTDVVKTLTEVPNIPGIYICNSESLPGITLPTSNFQMFCKVCRGELKTFSNSELSIFFNAIIKSLLFKFRSFVPCALCKLDFDIDISEEDELQVMVSAVCVGFSADINKLNDIEMLNKEENNSLIEKPLTMHKKICSMHLSSQQTLVVGRHSLLIQSLYKTGFFNKRKRQQISKIDVEKTAHGVQISCQSWLPRTKIFQHIGNLNFFIIRESTSLREDGGLHGFMHMFLVEVLAMCRSHVLALGGNSLLSFQFNDVFIYDNAHKNQAQCLINVSGDVVFAENISKLESVDNE